jgi:hypothetical protein
VIFQLFAEGIRQPREAPDAHPHRQILALNKARADMLLVRVVARDAMRNRSDAFRRTVALLPSAFLSRQIRPEMSYSRFVLVFPKHRIGA